MTLSFDEKAVGCELVVDGRHEVGAVVAVGDHSGIGGNKSDAFVGANDQHTEHLAFGKRMRHIAVGFYGEA